MQDIISEKKRAFTEATAIKRELPNYVQFTVKYMMEVCLISYSVIRMYFPENAHAVDKDFAWTIFETSDPVRA